MSTMLILVVVYFGVLFFIGVMPEEALKILLVGSWIVLALALVGSLAYQTLRYITA